MELKKLLSQNSIVLYPDPVHGVTQYLRMKCSYIDSNRCELKPKPNEIGVG